MITQTGEDILLPYRIVGYDRHGHTFTLMQASDERDARKKYPEYANSEQYAGVDLVHVLAHSEQQP